MRRMWKVVLLATALAMMATPVIANGGFEGPLFGMDTAPNGDVLVADLSSGVHAIRHGAVSPVADLPGVTDVGAIGHSSMWATTTGAFPEEDSGQAVWRISRGSAHMLANLFEFEETYDPDGGEAPDSNPFDVQSLGGNEVLVVDAGGNDLLRVNRRGNVEVVAVFPDELVSTDNIKALAGCPDSGAPFCFLPSMMPAQSVPTSVALGPDGYYYVGELRGFPAPTGASSVWKVAPGASWADCGSSADCTKVFDGGFTSIIDLAFGPDGKLYVAEFDEASWAAVEIFGGGVGGTINACDLDSLTCDEVATDINMLTSITFGKDGTLYHTVDSLIPNLADVVAAS